MFSIKPPAGNSLAGLAYKHLGNTKYFRELAELNDLNVLKDLSRVKSILVPTKEDLQGEAMPLLKGIADDLLANTGLPSASTIQGMIEQRDVKGAITQVAGIIEGRTGSGDIVQLVDWLL